MPIFVGFNLFLPLFYLGRPPLVNVRKTDKFSKRNVRPKSFSQKVNVRLYFTDT